MEGMTDWNKLTMEQYIKHLEEKFKVDSSGTAKAVFELIRAYKAFTIPIVINHVCGCTKTTQVNKINDSWICTECNRPIVQ